MARQHYRLVFRLLSPLHIGYRRVGNLMETRRYVPGKVLWAALTARLTRDKHDGRQGSEYRDIGLLIHRHFRFSYLWPSTDGELPYFPWDGGFDYLFLGSYAGTALDYDRRAAEEGLLREAEFIAPVTREGEKVYLLGDLWVDEPLPPDLANWRDVLEGVQLGGERGYGWGRVHREKCDADGTDHGDLGRGIQWEVQGSDVILAIPEGVHITAHALAAGDGALQGVTGPVEPLVGWERRENGGYRLTEDVRIAYAPGAVATRRLSVRVGGHGVWEMK